MIENDKPPSKTSFIQNLRRRIASKIFRASSLNEVSSQLEQAHLTDLIDKEAFFIADRALKLGERKTKEIMVPKIEMVTISVGESHKNIIEKVISSGHSRFPVLGNAANEVLGLMLAKDIIPELVNGSEQPCRRPDRKPGYRPCPEQREPQQHHRPCRRWMPRPRRPRCCSGSGSAPCSAARWPGPSHRCRRRRRW